MLTSEFNKFDVCMKIMNSYCLFYLRHSSQCQSCFRLGSVYNYLLAVGNPLEGIDIKL